MNSDKEKEKTGMKDSEFLSFYLDTQKNFYFHGATTFETPFGTSFGFLITESPISPTKEIADEKQFIFAGLLFQRAMRKAVERFGENEIERIALRVLEFEPKRKLVLVAVDAFGEYMEMFEEKARNTFKTKF